MNCHTERSEVSRLGEVFQLLSSPLSKILRSLGSLRMTFSDSLRVWERGFAPLKLTLFIPLYLEAVKFYRLIRVDSRLLAADINLLGDTINPLKVG